MQDSLVISAKEMTLLCPNCLSGNTNQITADTYMRDEDKSEGIAAKCTLYLHKCEVVRYLFGRRAVIGNPSSRRHGTQMIFECEDCPAYFALNVAQHKGATLISTVIVPTADLQGKL